MKSEWKVSPWRRRRRRGRSRHSRRWRHRSSKYLKTRPGRGSERSRRRRVLWWRHEHVSGTVTRAHTHTHLHPSHGGHCERYPKKGPSQQTDPGFQTQTLDGGRDEGETRGERSRNVHARTRARTMRCSKLSIYYTVLLLVFFLFY